MTINITLGLFLEILFVIWWLAVGILGFFSSKEQVDDFIEGECDGSGKAIAFFRCIHVSVVALWPLFLLGFGCGAGASYIEDKLNKISKSKMNRFVLRHSIADEYPETKEQWVEFFSLHIRKMPRNFLVQMNSSYYEMGIIVFEEKEIRKIVADELAERDIFGIKG